MQFACITDEPELTNKLLFPVGILFLRGRYSVFICNSVVLSHNLNASPGSPDIPQLFFVFPVVYSRQ